MTSQNPVDVIIGEESSPSENVTEDEKKKLSVSRITVQGNYRELKEIITGDLGLSGLLVVQKDEDYTRKIGTLYRLLHNYLSSVYSYNEHAQSLIESKSDADITLVPNDDTTYTRKLAFIRGLRISAQHGDYSCLKHESIENSSNSALSDDATAYQIKFRKNGFEGTSVNNWDKYERFTHYEDRKWVLGYISEFHSSYFENFDSHLQDWLERS